MAGATVSGNFDYQMTSQLVGLARTQVKDYAYKNIITFLRARSNIAVNYAVKYTIQQYPEAKNRDQKRRFYKGAHLQDSWSVDRSGLIGDSPKFKLKNSRPDAAMLIYGFSSASVIKPKNFLYSYAGGKKVPVLVYPSNDGRRWVPFNQALKNPNTVVRPVPVSQKVKPDNDSIPFKAIKQAFVSAADRRIRAR